MTTLCFVFGRTQSAPSLFLYGFRKNRDFAGISLGSERFLGEEEQRQQADEKNFLIFCFSPLGNDQKMSRLMRGGVLLSASEQGRPRA